MQKLTPEQALETLMAGNTRYVANRQNPHDYAAERQGLVQNQEPFAAVIRCADSRVAPEIIFDQAMGELFVCGVAGNIPTDEIIASLEYAVSILGTPLIMIEGHTNCGAVHAALTHRNDLSQLPGSLPDLITQILPCTSALQGDESGWLDQAVTNNVNAGIRRILERSQVIQEAVESGTCQVLGGVYHLESGIFNLIDGESQ
ncbi:MAG: carbonic anhydrase [Phycisphaerales bacterium]|nr:carbonic anhydrase [Phycisphaerales bacterium]